MTVEVHLPITRCYQGDSAIIRRGVNTHVQREIVRTLSAFLFSTFVLCRRYGDSARTYFVEVVQSGIDAVSRRDPAQGSILPTASLRKLGHGHATPGRPEKRQRTGHEGQDVAMRANGSAVYSAPKAEANGAGVIAAAQLAAYLRQQVSCSGLFSGSCAPFTENQSQCGCCIRRLSGRSSSIHGGCAEHMTSYDSRQSRETARCALLQ